MTRNDTPDRLEWSIRPHSGVDSAEWDWGIIMDSLPYIASYRHLSQVVLHLEASTPNNIALLSPASPVFGNPF